MTAAFGKIIPKVWNENSSTIVKKDRKIAP
jgi:hypothetical protein